MTRRHFGWLFLLPACQSRPAVPITPSPPREFTSAGGVTWTIRDARVSIPDGERPVPQAVADRLQRTTAEDAGTVRPAGLTLTVAAYRQTIREPGTQAPGDFRSVFSDASYAKNNPVKSGGPGESVFQMAALGFLELLNIGLFFGKTAVAVADKTKESDGEPGVTCELTGTVQMTWADGRVRRVDVLARGWAEKDAGEKTFREAAQSAQDRLADDVWRAVWQEIRSGP